MGQFLKFVAAVVLISPSTMTFTGEANADETAAKETTADIQIKKLIPAATGMSKADLKKLAMSPNPSPNMISNVSLSMELLKAPIDANTTKAMLAEFAYAKDTVPKPSILAEEYLRPVKGSPDLVTAVHFDRITKFTWAVSDNENAKGMVAYNVPKLYSGQFNYEAERKQGEWRVVRITMPARKIDLIRDEDGSWKKADNK